MAPSQAVPSGSTPLNDLLPEIRLDGVGRIGPGFGFGAGCGVGIGAGLIGGIGLGVGMPGLHLGAGVGASCGIGYGYGYGLGISFKKLFRKASKAAGVSVRMPGQPLADEDLVSELSNSMSRLGTAFMREMEALKRMLDGDDNNGRRR